MLCPDCCKEVRLWRYVQGWEEYDVEGSADDPDPQGSMGAPTGEWLKFDVTNVDVECGCDPCPWEATFDGDVTRRKPKEEEAETSG